jgi:peptidoglycan/LPS O-acetylase OafA/YrhL
VGALVIELLKKYVSDSPLFVLGYVFLGLIITIAVSAIVWQFIEKPSINLSKKVHLAS